MSADTGVAAVSAKIKEALDATRVAYGSSVAGGQTEAFLDMARIALENAYVSQRGIESERARRMEEKP